MCSMASSMRGKVLPGEQCSDGGGLFSCLQVEALDEKRVGDTVKVRGRGPTGTAPCVVVSPSSQ